MSEKTYLCFDELGYSASGKTRMWYVKNMQWNFTLGIIKWYAPWRRYAFFPCQGIFYDAECLEEVLAFLKRK
jgi:hypothetical protein